MAVVMLVAYFMVAVLRLSLLEGGGEVNFLSPRSAPRQPVTTPGGTAISVQTFTLTTSQDFSLTVAPVGLSVVQRNRMTTQVQLTNTGLNSVTGFVSLAATGLPTGMTGAFMPAQIAGGTTLAGRILATIDDEPIPGARVKIGGWRRQSTVSWQRVLNC